MTEAGKVLLGYSQQANALFVQAEQEIAALSGDHAGQLALGASTTIAQYVLPRLLGEFLQGVSPRSSDPDQRQHRADC